MSGPCWQLLNRHQQVLATVSPTSPFAKILQPSQQRRSQPTWQPPKVPTLRMPSPTTESRSKALHVLKISIVGQDHAGRNALVKLQQQMRNLKVTEEGGIQKWLSPTNPPHALGGRQIGRHGPSSLHWDGGARHTGWGPLDHQYHQELVKLDWNIFAYALGEQTISKLESAEPDILLRKELMAQLPMPSPIKSALTLPKGSVEWVQS